MAPPRPSFLRKPNRLTAFALALTAGLLVSSCSNDETGNNAQATGNAGPRPVSVDVMTLEPQTVQSIRKLTGRARAFAEAEIRPQVTGLIQERLFSEGQQVQAGDALYKIDAAEYRAAVQSAQAALDGAIATAAAANETAKRYKSLSEINAISRQDYDQAVATAKSAEASIGINLASLERARIDLQRTTVRTPISGQIGRSSVTPGALVTANQSQSLARVLQLDPIYVDMSAASSEVLRWKQDVSAGRIQSNNTEGVAEVPVTIEFENGTVYPETGVLRFTEVNVDENAGTVIVRAEVPNSGGLLLPGMFISANFSAGSYDNVFLVPQRAVLRSQQGNAYVFVVGEDNKARETQIDIMESNGSNWVVTDGLTSGDKLVLTGLQSLRNGSPLNVQTQSQPNGSGVSAGLN